MKNLQHSELLDSQIAKEIFENEKFTGSVRSFLKERKNELEFSESIRFIAQAADMCAWNELDKQLLYNAEANNETLFEVIKRLINSI